MRKVERKLPRGLMLWVKRGCVAFGLGVATTVAVAWVGGAYFFDASVKPVTAIVNGDTFSDLSTTRAMTLRTTVLHNWESGRAMTSADVLPPAPVFHSGKFVERSPVPAWSCAWEGSPPERWASLGRARMYEMATGWPWRALRCEFDSGTATATVRMPQFVAYDGVAAETRPEKSGTVSPRGLPLRPMWGGLAGDAMVFGVLWIPVLAAAAWVRQRIRARWQCSECGYDLRGQAEPGCPECGLGRVTA